MADITGYLKTIRDANSGETVRDAITSCMRDINEDGAVKKASLVITKPDNVTYKPGKGKAFSSVTVNITGGESNPNKTIHYETFRVTNETENGTYPQTPQEDTYYDKIEVAIDKEAYETPTNFGEQADIEFWETDETTGQKYWDASFAGYDYVRRINIPNSLAGDIPGGGDYPGGSGGAGPFKVTFYDRLQSAGSPHKIKEVTVEKNGDAAALFNSDGGAYPSYGGTFLRWDPPVNNVTKSMSTYARYYTPQSGSPVQIPKTWEEIIATADHSAFIGKFAYLEVKGENEGYAILPTNQVYRSKVYQNVTNPQEYNTLEIANPKAKFMIPMQCVALGESSSRSTWLAMNPLPYNYVIDGDQEIHSAVADKTDKGTDDWNSCYLHQFFEKCLIQGFPDVLKSNIRYVTKWSWGASQYPPISGPVDYLQKASTCKLWIPSVGEIDGMMTDYENAGGAGAPEFRESETGSVNYSQVWTPNGIDEAGSNVIIQCRSMARLSTYYGNLARYVKNGTTKTYNANGGDFSAGNPTGLYIGFCL